MIRVEKCFQFLNYSDKGNLRIRSETNFNHLENVIN